MIISPPFVFTHNPIDDLPLPPPYELVIVMADESIRAEVEHLNSQILSGQPGAEAAAEALFTKLNGEDLLAAAVVLPPSVCNRRLDVLMRAETECRATNLSKHLLRTGFTGVAKDKLWPVVSHVVDTLNEDNAVETEVFAWRRRLLQEVAPGDRSKCAIERHATNAIAYGIRNHSFYDFEGILTLASVKELLSTSNAELKALLGLCQNVFVQGAGVSAFNAATKTPEIQNFLEARDLVAAAKRKALLLALCKALGNKTTLSFQEIATATGIEVATVESALVDAMLLGVIDCLIDEPAQSVIVNAVTPLHFGDEEWRKLQAVLQQWIGTVDTLLADYSQ